MWSTCYQYDSIKDRDLLYVLSDLLNNLTVLRLWSVYTENLHLVHKRQMEPFSIVGKNQVVISFALRMTVAIFKML